MITATFIPIPLWGGAAALFAVLSIAPLWLLTVDLFSPQSQADPEFLFFRALAILVVWALCEVGRSFLATIVRYEVRTMLQRQVLQTLEHLPDVVSFSEKRSRILRDVETVEEWLSEKALNYFGAAITLGTSLLLWFWLEPAYAMRAAALFAFWAACFAWLGRRRVISLRALKDASSGQTKLFQEVLRGARAVQSLLSIPFILRRHEVLHQSVRRPHFARSGRMLGGVLLFQILSLVSGLLLWAWLMESIGPVLGGASVDRQFHATLWCLLILLAGWRVRSMGEETTQMRRAARSLMRQAESTAVPSPKIPGGVSDKMIWGIDFKKCLVKASGRTARLTKAVEIERGSIAVLLGPSGSGKSLVLEALCGLRKAHWEDLRIQDALGNVGGSSQGELCIPKELFAYVESSPFLFPGTVAENLTLGNTQRLSDMTLWQHLELVGLLPLVKSLGGLSAPLPRAVGKLSDSERFRLALVRALLLDRPFMALDDPFKALDEHSWRKLIPLLQLQKEFCGVIIACRQLPPRLNVDRVIHLGGTQHVPDTRPHPSPPVVTIDRKHQGDEDIIPLFF